MKKNTLIFLLVSEVLLLLLFGIVSNKIAALGDFSFTVLFGFTAICVVGLSYVSYAKLTRTAPANRHNEDSAPNNWPQNDKPKKNVHSIWSDVWYGSILGHSTEFNIFEWESHKDWEGEEFTISAFVEGDAHTVYGENLGYCPSREEAEELVLSQYEESHKN